MSDLRQRNEPIRSQKYLAGSRGQPCVFQIPNVCIDDRDTTVPCHLRDEHTGKSRKADDLSVGDGCSACHDMMDGRSGVLSERDWLFYALRGLQRTLRRRLGQGLLFVTQDPAPQRRETKAKPPSAPSRPIPQRESPWGPKGSRKIAQRQKAPVQ